MIGELHIQTAFRNGKTILKTSYCTQPFKLADTTEDKNDPVLRLMLMSSSPGILDNDDYKIQIEIDKGCSVNLETQSYQRLFQMKGGAKQNLEVRMQDSSSFIFLPHPSVPHESSYFSAKNTFYLSHNCFLIWGEILTCGRKLNGEVFRFSRYHSQTEIYLGEKLIMKENLLVAPALMDCTVVGQLEGYTHQASFTCIGPDFLGNSFVENIHELLSREKDICFGVSDLSVNGIVVRILGYHAEQLHRTLKTIAGHLDAFPKLTMTKKTPGYAK